MKDGVSLNQRSCREIDCWEPRGHSPSAAFQNYSIPVWTLSALEFSTTESYVISFLYKLCTLEIIVPNFWMRKLSLKEN